MPRPVASLTGQKFGRLVAIERTGSSRDGYAAWLCRCSGRLTEREALSRKRVRQE